jgi:hypothetical protein
VKAFAKDFALWMIILLKMVLATYSRWAGVSVKSVLDYMECFSRLLRMSAKRRKRPFFRVC